MLNISLMNEGYFLYSLKNAFTLLEIMEIMFKRYNVIFCTTMYCIYYLNCLGDMLIVFNKHLWPLNGLYFILESPLCGSV